ncbi:MAG: hypothetical protein QNJ90_10375 [Planctomycetota bacterium]|nr:hypothetical protein [Planctomycetota bacterium]
MRHVATVFGVFCLGVLLIFTAAACGGGGGSSTTPTPTADELHGTYFWHMFEGDIGPPLRNGSFWGTLTADGFGEVTGSTLSVNDGGSLFGPSALPGYDYTIKAGRRLGFLTASSPRGGVSADGRVATLLPIADGTPPSPAILLRRTGTFTLADLAGTYHACAFFSFVGVDSAWFAGLVTFDAAGGATYSSGINSNGVVTQPSAPIPYGTASVATDGTVTWAAPTPQVVWSGGMLAGGELIVFAGTTQAIDAQFLIVLIRQGTGLSNATWSGSYHFISIGAGNSPPPRYGAITGTATVDGAGSLAIAAETGNQDGTITPGGSLPSLPYLVGATGTLDTVGGGNRGAVSPSGDFAMFAGGTTPLSGPTLWFFHR